MARLIQKIKEKALREGDIQGAVSEDDFKAIQDHLEKKIPEKHPRATPDELVLIFANSLCSYFWGEKQAELVFPEEFTLQSIPEQPQETMVTQVASSNTETQRLGSSPEIPSINQSTLAPRQHQTILSFYGLNGQQWVNICRKSPHGSRVMFEDFMTATRQAIPSTQISTQQMHGNLSTVTEEATTTVIDTDTSSVNPSAPSQSQTVHSDTARYQSYSADSEGFPEEPPRDPRSIGVSSALDSIRNCRNITVGRPYMAPPAPPTRNPSTFPTLMELTEKGRDDDEQEHKFKRYRTHKRSSRYHS
ncbi:hypothetical protein BGAL_0020g00270 [Botrytis galanthina]|uniref:Uncharacterized protein n=1 Tax=Botrytis galanthina TaxID=278940 RepID=A0A4S8R9I9_9HELO|nr:hypothetical protein BGAL_0020g00270 [Botrytis galanthina]